MAENQTSTQPLRILILGATSAIALAVGRIYAAQGAHLYLVARSAPKLQAVWQDLQVRGATVLGAVADLDDTTLHPSLLEAAAQGLGSIDVALLAHGVLGDQARAEASYPVTEAVLVTNLLAPVSLITWLANYFEQRKAGTLAVITSVAGDRGRKSNYVYGASKGGLSLFLDGVRNRIDRAGVNVLTIKPGFVSTPMTQHLPPSPLFAPPAKVAKGITLAIRKRKDVVYVPGFWFIIMWIVQKIPVRIFKKMNM